MLFFAPWVKLVPMPVLAGILIVIAYNMSEWRTFRSYLKGSAFDVVVLLSTFFLTVLVDLTVAIEVGIVLSALLFMKRMADLGKSIPTRIDTDVIEDYSSLPKGLMVYEISGPLFFASAREYCEVMKDLGVKGKVIIIRMRHVPFADSTGMKNLKGAIKILLDSGTKVVLSGVNDTVRADLEKFSVEKMIGADNILPVFDQALIRAKQIL
jgi:SulP family sulfate permease